MGKQQVVSYAASPTASRFHQSEARIKLLVGPVGSGSSTACIFDFILRAIRQTPDPDGVRRHTVLIARNSYPKLKTTVKKTLEHWIPDAVGFELSGQAPITGCIERPLGDGTSMKLDIILMAFQDASKIEEDLRSFEYSSLWINEAKENHPWLLKYGQQRLGRAPAKISDPSDPDPNGPNPYPPLFNGCDEPTILLDTNMYDDDEWLYDFFHIKHADNPNIVKFEQPPALMECEVDDPEGRYFAYLDTYLKENPDAENIRWLPAEYNYYWNILETSPETVWTDVLNRVGSTQSGKPVFSSYYYNDRVHYKPYFIKPNPSYPLLIGVDWGVRYSSYVFCQYYNGGLKILEELVIKDLGLVQQMDDFVVPILNTKYIECTNRISIADPAGRARDPIDGIPQFTLLTSRWGLPCRLAISNSPSARIDAMKNLLRREGGLEMSSNITVIRKGFQGKYKFKEKRGLVGATEMQYRDEPDKNEYSHPMDAVCYVALDVTSDATVDLMSNDYAQDDSPLVLV